MTTRLDRCRARRLVGATTVVGMLASACLLLLATVPASAAPTAMLSATSGIVDGQVIQVTVTLDAPTPAANVFLAVTQCGNATATGAPLAVAAADDCAGATDLGSSLQLLGSGGLDTFTGPVAAGTYTIPLTMKRAGLGLNGAQCVAVAAAVIPCTVQIATATLSGAYVGAGSFTVMKPFTYEGQEATTTTTSVATTTTASLPASSTTTIQASTTTVPASTSTTQAPGTTTTMPVTTTTTPSSGSNTARVTPNTGLAAGEVVDVEITLVRPTPGDAVFVGVTQCGNASADGTPLTVSTADDCVGAEGLGSSLQVLGSGGVGTFTGPVPAGTYHVPLTLTKSGIGKNGAQCVPVPPGVLPCTVQVSTAELAGAYTGKWAFTIVCEIEYSSGTTTTTVPSGTTTTTAHGTTSTTTGNSTTTMPGTTTASTAQVMGTTQVPPTSTVTSSGVLPYTGVSRSLWWQVALGVLLIDVGYLAATIVSRPRQTN